MCDATCNSLQSPRVRLLYFVRELYEAGLLWQGWQARILRSLWEHPPPWRHDTRTDQGHQPVQVWQLRKVCGNSERYADMADVSKEHEIWCVCMHAQVHPNPLFASTFAGMIICKHQVPFPPAALRRRDLLRHSRLPWESFEAAVATLADDPPATARAFLDFLRVVFVSLTFVGFLFLAPGVLKTSPPIFWNSNSSLKPTRRLHSPTGAKPSVNM